MRYKNIFYLSESPIQSNDAGNKARNDIEKILKKMNFSKVAHFHLAPNHMGSKIKHVKYILHTSYLHELLKLMKTKSKILILQYPFYFERIENFTLKNSIKKNKTILFIHDINGLRSPIIVNGIEKMNLKSIEQDKDAFNNAKVLIVHNKEMQKILREWGISTPIVVLDVFDYLLKGDRTINTKRSLSTTIAYAGNLDKSKFLELEEIQKLKLSFNLYGPNYTKEKFPWHNIHYKGSFSPDEIPYQLEGGFGLIWDGTSIKSCDGWKGRYMRINNPHKLSLYIAAGMPVITWNQAAIADFIKRYNIGFCVDNLEEIMDVIANLTESDYRAYINNIHKLQQDVMTGNFTKRAIEKAVKLLY